MMPVRVADSGRPVAGIRTLEIVNLSPRPVPAADREFQAVHELQRERTRYHHPCPILF